METAHESGWLVVDAFDVMFHLFLAQTRERYGLDRLWRDATEISVSKLLKEHSVAAPSKRSKGHRTTGRPRKKTGKNRPE
jgi:ribosome-associated protein